MVYNCLLTSAIAFVTLVTTGVNSELDRPVLLKIETK